MIINFEDQEFHFDFDEIDVKQARTLKRRYGLTLMGLQTGLTDGDVDALLAVYWLMHDQSGKTTNTDRVNFSIVAFANAFGDASEESDKAKEEEAPKAA